MSKKLSASKRARMIMLLQRARIRIKDQDNSYICFALSDVVTYMLPFNDDKRVAQAWVAVDDLCDWIHSMLGNYVFTLSDWLIAYGHVDFVKPQKIRQIRLKWIDWMINELKEGR